MNQKTNTYIYIFFLLFFYQGLSAQTLSLKIVSKNKTEVIILDKIDYKKKHKDTITLNLEIDRISEYLKKNGYFTHIIDSIKNVEREYLTYFSLNKKIDKAVIKITTEDKFLLKKTEIKKNVFSIPIEKLQSTLSNISETLDKEGKSFSNVKLKNILIKKNILFADLNIYQSKKRIINRVVVKGYEDFPKSHIINYFNIKSNSVFNQHKIKKISDVSKNLKFIKEIKPPEVLFTKDSTLLYLFLKKQQNNSFDGIVNFASKENGELLFNGNIDLKLNNILNKGEKLELFWNSIGEEKQEFKLSSEVPYMFNSRISPQLSFSIYKQDSTFLNTKFDSKLFYNINPKIKLALTYSSESSEKLEETINNNIKTFSNYFLGFQFEYSIPKNDFFFNDKFSLTINPTFGGRKIAENSLNQFKIETSTSLIWDLNLRNSLFIKNTIGYLNSDTFIDNELFRIGGANSIRGYNEQSIFTSNYTYFNFEYRYLTSEKSYLYTITDFAKVKTKLKTENLISIGLGYLFSTKKSQINLSTAIGKDFEKNFDFKSTKIIINWKTYF